MPHIECVKNNGKPYLRLAESRYVKDIGKQKKFIIKNIGPLSKYDDGKPDFLKRFREKFKNGEIDFDGITYYSNLPTKNTFQIDNEQNYIDLKNMGFLFLQSVYNSLGISQILNQIKFDSKIEYDLNGLVKMLVFGRILDPQSKKKTFENRNRYLFPIVSSEEIKEVLNGLKACSDKNGTCLISTPKKEIEQIVKSIGLEIPDLTTIDKIDKFKNRLNKGLFM